MRNNRFCIKKIIKKNSYITFEYEVDGEFKKYFWMGEMFNIDYENINIEEVPDSIAVIPLVANVLPIIWLNDALLEVPELDKDFYKCIKKLRRSYRKMLPMCKFKGKIKVEKLVKNKSPKNDKSATFFTGGVDSYSTYINIKNENPDFITVWGADIDWENVDGFKKVRDFVSKIGESEKVNNIFVHAAVRRFIDNSELEKTYLKVFNDNWWHAVQHSIGIISLAAPLAYIKGYERVYFASTYTQRDRDLRHIVCASLPEIDNNVKFAGVKVIHEGFENSRMDKVKRICDYSKKIKKDVPLHVCYRSLVGDNCSECEKCYRTIVAILTEGEDPSKYGFKYNKKVLNEMIKYMMKTDKDYYLEKLWWIDIANNLKSKKHLNRYQKDATFLYDVDFIKNFDVENSRVK